MQPITRTTIPFCDALRFWLQLGFISFGARQGKLPSCTASWWASAAGCLSSAFCKR